VTRGRKSDRILRERGFDFEDDPTPTALRRALFRHADQAETLDAADRPDGDLAPDQPFGERPVQIVDARHRHAVERDDDVPGRETRPRRRTAFGDVQHEHAHHPEIRAPDAAVAQQVADHQHRRSDRNREADRLAAGDDRGVHAHHLGSSRDQRSSRAARVQRGVARGRLVSHADDEQTSPGGAGPAGRCRSGTRTGWVAMPR
jgi:hypothetical protein